MKYVFARTTENECSNYSIVVYPGIQINIIKEFYINDISYTVSIYDPVSETIEICLNFLIENDVLIFERNIELKSKSNKKEDRIRVFKLTQNALLQMI